MQSDASTSSPKRSASQDPQSFQSNDVPGLSLPDNNREIDAYMAEQGEDHGQAAASTAGTVWTSAQKLEFVKHAQDKPMQVGETWYIVYRRWHFRWKKAMTGEEDKEGRVEEKDLGPVDNTPLCDQRGQVTSDLIEHVDCEFVPEELWTKLLEWYGEPKYPLPRKVIARGLMQEPILELRPPSFKVHLLAPTSVPGQSTPVKEVTVSSTDKIRAVRHTFAAAVSPQKAALGQFRVWKTTSDASMDQLLFPADTLRTCGASLLEDDDNTVGDELVDTSEVFVVELMTRDKWLLEVSEVAPPTNGAPAPSAPPPPPPPTQPGPLFGSGTDFFTQLQQKAPPVTNATTTSAFKPAPSNALTKSSARPRVQHDPGTLGLGNMGNTCFMNSAIQCLAHNTELVDYFLTGVYQEELNPDNPLGMHGQVAQAFGALMSRIWDPESTMSSYTPREFKQTLQRFAPQFSGYQQHDSQELVAFLLDGLHEDLNRVLKKPYVEKPDWEGGGDKELVELANTSWEGYMKRNDSVVVDLFQGQYQSTLVCPECSKVSITFDPFMYLTLPLPVQKKWHHTILYIPWDLEKPHVRVPVELNRHSSFKDVRQLLGRWMGADPDNLLTLEVFSHQFYKNLDDTVVCEDMAENDVIVCFELPCNAQQSRTYKPDPDDPFIIPVFPCESPPLRPTYRSGPNLFGYPFVTVIDQEQAKDPEAIYDAIVSRLQRWTVQASHLSTWEAGSADDMEPVHIPISGSPVVNSITEIKENGEVVTVEEAAPEEGDIADEKASVVHQEDEDDDMGLEDAVPRKVGFKRDLFTIRVQKCEQAYGVGRSTFGNNHSRYETWEQRASAKSGILLRPNDAFYIEFDDGVKSFYFGDERNSWEYALWNHWDEFVHPELAASRKAASTQKQKGITLQDCLDEFTKEEKLGADDLWYCPSCKKHQQATKRFDLWKLPDVLVVHLKRFSNSRMLRDKIDTFVDFPIEGLDLTEMVGERLVGSRLREQGADVEALGLDDLDEPLQYDLFGVDEHLGGLGGGHYRAYALNHVTGKWYHFDDSYVTESRPEAAVNGNAYLLFYRRRTSRPLGGKSHAKIEEARALALAQHNALQQEAHQLPTPPSDGSLSRGDTSVLSNAPTILDWPTPTSMNSSSPASSPLPLDDRPPNFDDALLDPVMQSSLGLGDLPLVGGQLELPDPLSRGSPSSIDAEPDLENDDTDSPFYQPDGDGSDDYDLSQDFSQDSVRLRNAVFKRDGSPEEEDPADVLMTPAESELDETDSAPYEMSDDTPIVESTGAAP
ncbi:Ubiquitin carboxyl-terminal hydrolase 4 [Trametes pubescens]|uniref:ubiquitinyl hydrolase 1 n=1 Tax=Trametes pubescens TaxID=154538 RepID=A0A1M2V5L5_TRAPU|nr:Ubiquitin carboxyl-terminal hydrolase 4 [Trametes pubescens]